MENTISTDDIKATLKTEQEKNGQKQSRVYTTRMSMEARMELELPIDYARILVPYMIGCLECIAMVLMQDMIKFSLVVPGRPTQNCTRL